jgi:hypothetical protein
MSDLATAIKENTEALRALTDALTGVHFTAHGSVTAPTAALSGVSTVRGQSASVDAPEPEVLKQYQEHQKAQAALEYERDVKPVGLKLAAKDKAMFNNLLAGFGVKKGTELLPEQWPDFIARAKACLDE